MNFFQKRFLTLAAFIANISLTLTVAGVASFAWFQTNQLVPVETNSVSANITATVGNSLDYEFLNFSDSDAEGVSTLLTSDFKLKDYDKYIGQKNDFTNSILRVTIGGLSLTEDKDFFVDITCQSGHTPSISSSRKEDFTSNVAQFKILTYSYTKDGVESKIAGIPTYDPADLDASANSRYRYLTNYFATQGLPGTRFVSLHNNNVLHKPYDTISLIAPSIAWGENDTGSVSSVTVYLECSYNRELAKLYNGPVQLTADITDINFRVGDRKRGAYAKVGTTIKQKVNGVDTDVVVGITQSSDDRYMITYDGFAADDLAPALDGNLATSSALNGKNYIDVYERGNFIPHTAITDASDFSYNSNTLTTHSGLNVGLTGNASYTSGTGYINAQSGENYTNNIAFNTNHTNIQSGQKADRYLQYSPSYGYFEYYDSTQQDVQMYKLYESLDPYITLTNLSLSSNSGTTTFGSSWQFNETVYANYQDGHREDVTDKVTITSVDTHIVGTHTINISYVDSYYGAPFSTQYTLTVINPVASLDVDYSNVQLYYRQNTDSFDKEHLVVTVAYEDGSQTVLDPNDFYIYGFNNATKGEQEIVVKYDDPVSGDTISAEGDNVFSVYVVDAYNSSKTYTLVTSVSSLSTNDKVVVATNNTSGSYGATGWDSDKDATVSTTTSEWQEYVVNKSTDTFTLYDSSAEKYIANPTGNEFKYNATTGGDCSVDSNGYLICNSRYLCKNGNNYRFYTSIGSYTGFKVYKVVENGSPITGIAIVDKKTTTYYTGQSYEEPELVAIHADGSYSELTSGVTKNPSDPLSDSFSGPQHVQTVEFTYSTFSTSYSITVIKRVPVSISVSNPKTTFVQGEAFSFGNDASATITFNDGSHAPEGTVPDFSFVDTNVLGPHIVTASYTSGGTTVSTTYEINVVEASLSSISLNTDGVQIDFIQGETFNYDNLVVYANYNNNHSAVVTPTSVSSPAMGTVATGVTVTVSYTEGGITETATYEININAAELVVKSGGSVITSSTLIVGETLSLTAKVTNDENISWTLGSGASTYVSVSSVSPGTSATVTALKKTTSAVTVTASATVNGYPVSKNISITVNSPTVTLSPNTTQTISLGSSGNTFTISATVSPNYNHDVDWTMSKSGVISLSKTTTESGETITVSAVSADTVTLTATCDEGSASIEVTVLPAVVTVQSIEIQKNNTHVTEVSGGPGDEIQLKAVTTPASPTVSNLKWYSTDSNNPQLISVSSTGKVTISNSATSSNSATIWVFDDVDDDGVKDSDEPQDSCSVSVVTTQTGSETLVSNTSTTYYQSGYITGSGSSSSATWNGTSFTATQAKNSSNTNVSLTYAEIRVYTSHTFTIAPKSGYTITSIVINANSNSYASAVGTVSNGSKSTSGSTVTITPTDGTQSVVITQSSQTRFNSVVINYSTGSSGPTLSSIAVSTAPTKTTYNAGEFFAPAGLVLTLTYSDNSTGTVTYSSDNASQFTFTPSTNTALTTSNTSVTIGYGGKTCSQPITVNSSGSTDDTTITFSDLGLKSGTQYTTFYDTGSSSTAKWSITFGDGANDGKYYSTGTGIRVYNGGYLTIQTRNSSTAITKIVLKFSSSSYAATSSNCSITLNTGGSQTSISYNGSSNTVTTWEGSATSIRFNSSFSHWRLQSVHVYYSY